MAYSALKKAFIVVFYFATACHTCLGGMSGVIPFSLVPNNFFFLFLSNSTPNLLKFYISPLIIFYIYLIFQLIFFYLNYFIKLKFIFNFIPFQFFNLLYLILVLLIIIYLFEIILIICFMILSSIFYCYVFLP
jgi:hypothetical protein